jgi:hypothetical protein
MNKQSPSEVLGNLASIASLNPFSPFTMGLNDILDMVKTGELSVSTGDNPVTKEEIKKVMDKSDTIVLDSCVGVRIQGNRLSDRKVMTGGGLVKQILQISKSNFTILNALGYIGYDYFELKKYLRCRKMSLSEFLGTLSKPQLIEIHNYVLNRG